MFGFDLCSTFFASIFFVVVVSCFVVWMVYF